MLRTSSCSSVLRSPSCPSLPRLLSLLTLCHPSAGPKPPTCGFRAVRPSSRTKAARSQTLVEPRTSFRSLGTAWAFRPSRPLVFWKANLKVWLAQSATCCPSKPSRTPRFRVSTNGTSRHQIRRQHLQPSTPATSRAMECSRCCTPLTVTSAPLRCRAASRPRRSRNMRLIWARMLGWCRRHTFLTRHLPPCTRTLPTGVGTRIPSGTLRVMDLVPTPLWPRLTASRTFRCSCWNRRPPT